MWGMRGVTVLLFVFCLYLYGCGNKNVAKRESLPKPLPGSNSTLPKSPLGVNREALMTRGKETTAPGGNALSAKNILAKAESAYEAKEEETAQKLYLKAAGMGNADAHFALFYKFILSDAEDDYHISEAAKGGHAKALDYALNRFFWRAGMFLDDVKPGLALKLFEEAKASNPDISEYGIDTIKMCVEMCEKLGPFDAAGFRKKYKIKNPNKDATPYLGPWYPYFIWSLAEEACRGGRFGKPNRVLAFQLVIHGGTVPAEIRSAVGEAYRKWKNNEPYQFAIEDHVTSGSGGGFLREREHRKVDQLCKSQMKAMGTSLSAFEQGKSMAAYDEFAKFVEKKVWNEEGHDGSGWVDWGYTSIIEHKKEYVKLANSVSKGFKPAIRQSYDVADHKLNKVYKALIADLKKSPFKPGRHMINHQDIIDVQRLWIPYRDSTAELFSVLNAYIDIMAWKSWLTGKRTEQLQELIDWKKEKEAED